MIVDFKTDVGLSAESINAYWRQLSIYAILVHGATGQPVSELALVFCRADPAQVFRQWAVD
jgi:ATP-dependent helicase/nuclease subunit A